MAITVNGVLYNEYYDLPDDATIVKLVAKCPRRRNTKAAAHWKNKYRNGMTIAAFKKRGGQRGRLICDMNRGNLMVVKS